MSKKSDSFYFDNFIECASISCEAAEMLKSLLSDFSVETLQEKRTALHQIEHRGDDKRHEMIRELVRAFITPLEREDLLKLSQTVDDVTDSIEDIGVHIYFNNITQIRPESIEFADIVIQCCSAMKDLLRELPNFKKSKTLKDLIIELNRLEELGDDMYVKFMRDLHTTSTDPIEIIVWREIYDFFEKCCDVCESVADIVEGIIIANS